MRVLLTAAAVAGLLAGREASGMGDVTFSQSATDVDRYDFVEVTAAVRAADLANPFTDVELTGSFGRKGAEAVAVEGFCDSPDGSVYRIRFMPREAGTHAYTVTLRHGAEEKTHAGTFRARKGRRRGPVRVDRDHPWHFVWEGTGEHYFWNATTTYFLMGWDDRTIRAAIDRLARLEVNRMRVAINGRVKDGRAWYEDVYPNETFSFLLNPWVAKRPKSLTSPGFDVTRFNVDYWRKWDRMLRVARERDVIISVVFYVDGRRPGTDPFGRDMGGPDEQRYYRYAAARFAAFANVMWDVANEYRQFRSDAWAEKMGTLLKQWDPYDHLMSVHGHGDFRFGRSPWADFAMYQQWDEHGGNAFMLDNRRTQQRTGRIIPQVNEEYGYESHYPRWGGNRKPPARSADNRRRLAWEIYLAGCYQTTGERAQTEAGWADRAGGGWINGRGDDSMVMLEGYGHIAGFFATFEWWKTDPHNELVGAGALCLAEPGRQYVVYLPNGGQATLKAKAGTYAAAWFNPRTGTFARTKTLRHAGGPLRLTAPDDSGDMVLRMIAR